MKLTLKTFCKGNLLVVLDRDRVNVDDPGADTPAMVYLMKNGKSVARATYWCACGESSLMGDDGDYPLSETQCAWLDGLDRELTQFLYAKQEVNT